MLKLIPEERPERPDRNTEVHATRKNKKKKQSPPKLQQKFDREMGDEQRVLKTVCVKFIRYIKTESPSDTDRSDLIHDLQKSVLSLQRQRQKLMWRARSKKKRKE